MIICGKEKKWTGFEYGLTGNVLYVNDSRIVYAEYLPKYDMTLIHLSVSNKLISCAGDIGDALKMVEGDHDEGGISMPDRDKVIKGLECCMAEKICSSKCPYKGQCDDGGYYYSRAIEEAIELLKAQDAPQADEAAAENQEYCEKYEPTYNPEDGSL